MPYDPKRPRPVVADDDPAPVEALITSELPVVDPSVAPEAEIPEPVETAEPIDEAPAAVSTEEVVDLTDATAPTPSPVAAALGGSDVPVAPVPAGPTANRAVAVAAGVAALVSLLVLLLLRRRRR